MVQILFILTFIISLASAAYGLLLSNELRKKNNRIYTAVLFQQLLIHVFILYGIWGQIISNFILKTELSNNAIIGKLSILIVLLAIPFLLASWWFFLYISLQLKKSKKQKLRALVLLLLSIAIITISSSITNPTFTILEHLTKLFIYENLVLTAWIVFQFISTKELFKRKIIKLGTIGVLIIMSAAFLMSLKFKDSNEWIIALFIILYSICNVWLPITFKYFTEEIKDDTAELALNFNSLCEKYNITKRESEIIQLISDGLTNKIISDKLFITLQTVKDHTSRIYLKTEVKNRTQLANLFRDKIQK